jgi:hypothetical protein
MIIYILYVIIGFRDPVPLYEFRSQDRCERMAAEIRQADNALAYCEEVGVT